MRLCDTLFQSVYSLTVDVTRDYFLSGQEVVTRLFIPHEHCSRSCVEEDMNLFTSRMFHGISCASCLSTCTSVSRICVHNLLIYRSTACRPRASRRSLSSFVFVLVRMSLYITCAPMPSCCTFFPYGIIYTILLLTVFCRLVHLVSAVFIDMSARVHVSQRDVYMWKFFKSCCMF